MKARKSLIAVAILFPILVLMVWNSYIVYDRSSVTHYVLSIQGFDPFNPLQGHYLRYSIDYELPDLCSERSSDFIQGYGFSKRAYVCLEPRKFSYSKPTTNCLAFIEGNCVYGRFNAGIEQFYIPQENARSLEMAIQKKTAKIVVSVGHQGRAYVIDLLINNMPWKKYISLKDEI